MSMAMIIVQSLTNSFGEAFIAANVIVMRVDGFAMLPNMSFGTAMTTYTGQNVGAKKHDRVIQGAKQGTLLAVATSTILTLLILTFGKQLMGIFTETASLVDLSRTEGRLRSRGGVLSKFISIGVVKNLDQLVLTNSTGLDSLPFSLSDFNIPVTS